MALPRAIYREAQLLPLCWLPCAVRFAIWCFRVAKLSAQGSESARLRLQEVHSVLQKPGAAAALERCIGLLLENADPPLDIREFGLGSVYSSETELDLLLALSALQAGDTVQAKTLFACLSRSHLGEIVESAGIWTAQLQEVGVLLSISGSVLRLPSKRTTLVEMSR
jgi:hypothetical protein